MFPIIALEINQIIERMLFKGYLPVYDIAPRKLIRYELPVKIDFSCYRNLTSRNKIYLACRES